MVPAMAEVLSAHAVSVDGVVTGRAPGPGRGLGDGGKLFDRPDFVILPAYRRTQGPGMGAHFTTVEARG